MAPKAQNCLSESERKQELSMRKDLLRDIISSEEYFVMLLSLLGVDRTYEAFPELISSLKRLNFNLYNLLHETYVSYFEFKTSPRDLMETPPDKESVPTRNDPEDDLQFAIRLSLLEEQGATGGSDIYEPDDFPSINWTGEVEENPETASSMLAKNPKDNQAWSNTRVKNEDHGIIDDALSKSRSTKKKRKKKTNTLATIKSKPIIYWLRRDLRLYDNPALVAASETGSPVIPVFIWSELEEGPLAAGGATKLWLHHALKELQHSYSNNYNSRIIFSKTNSCKREIMKLVECTGSKHVIWNDLYEPICKNRDDDIERALQMQGVRVERFHSYLLHYPESLQTEGVSMLGIGSVSHFMQLSQRSQKSPIGIPLEAPGTLQTPDTWPVSSTLDDLELAKMPRRKNGTVIDWAAPIVACWDFSEEGGYGNLLNFLSEAIKNYDKESGRSDMKNTSIISPYLHFGQLTPRQVLYEAKHKKCAKFLRKLAWRDMSYWLLHLYPTLDSEPVRPPYKHQRWSYNKQHLKAWQRGRTGYPLVDASMRQLWLTGWMNNYMRHVVASFLISYLHLHWVEGYNWFQDTLLDADVAINAMMWQNGGMSGLDHWNFVMHPVDAAMTCDPRGDYVRKWCPELSALPNDFIHKPWACPQSMLRRANVQLGVNYPQRIITDLHSAREKSLRDVVEVRHKFPEFIDSRSGNDLVPLPSGRLIPVITRREFKYKTAHPAAQDNPHTAVLRGYRSRKRDELVAFEKKVDFLASTMDECIVRHERGEKNHLLMNSSI